MRDKPATGELLKFGVLLLFLLLGLSVYVDDLGLTCGLLLNYALDDNDVIIVGLSHVRHRSRCRDHLRLLLRWIVCSYQYGGSILPGEGVGYGDHEAGGQPHRCLRLGVLKETPS